MPVHRLAPQTDFRYGNIGTIDEHDHGFNGNAGLIVTDSGVVVIDSLCTPTPGRRLIATVRALTSMPAPPTASGRVSRWCGRFRGALHPGIPRLHTATADRLRAPLPAGE